MEYDWPGNIRELVNALEHGFALCSVHQIELKDLPVEISGQNTTYAKPSQSFPARAPLHKTRGSLWTGSVYRPSFLSQNGMKLKLPGSVASAGLPFGNR